MKYGMRAALFGTAITIASIGSTPAYATVNFTGDEIGGTAGAGSVPIPNNGGGLLVTPGPVPQPSPFVWTVSGAGLLLLADISTITSIPGGPGGTVGVRRADGSLFRFFGADYSLNSLDQTIPLFTLQVSGFLNNSVVGNTSLQTTSLGSFSTSGAGALAGLDVDELRFRLDGARLTPSEFGDGSFVRSEFSMSLRSLDVGSATLAAAVPEPSTWALLIMGFGLVGAAMRRRRQALTVMA